MITKQEANTIVESVIEEMAELGWGGHPNPAKDAALEAGRIVEIMLRPVTEKR
jgi:hypothetical protein